MPPKRTSTSAAPAMTQASIPQLVADSVAGALEAQAATISRSVCLICWFERTKLVFSRSNCTEDCKVKFATVLCPNMVPNAEKLMEPFIEGLSRSIEGNVTASKPKTLVEAITITQRLMDQVTKHDAEQGTNDHKQKFDDRRNNNNNYPNNHDNNNYPNDRNNNNYQNNRNNNNYNRNNDYHQQQNGRQETFRTYGNRGYNGPRPLFGRGIPLGQGILGESTSSKFHFAVLGVSLGPVLLLGLLVFAMVAAYASYAAAISYRMAA
nr:hypothetical protein [Tanacetum cinerariifolium]